MARLMIISAGWEQLSLIKAARDMGHHIIATHTDPKAEGFAHVSQTHLADPRDLPQLLEIAVAEAIDGVISDQCDYSYFASAYIAEKLSKPGPGLTTANWIANKGRVRCRLQQCNDIRQPGFAVCVNYQMAMAATEAFGLPVVVKPVDNRGSIGVLKVEDQAQLKDAFFYALGQSRAREVLVEEYIQGIEVAVDGYCLKDDGHRILSIASKEHAPNGLFDNEIVTPARIAPQVLTKLKTVTPKVVAALELGFGATHIEFMVTADEDAYLMEAHNRGGGIHISDKVNPLVSGIDTPKCLVQDSLGLPNDHIHRPDTKAHTMIRFITLPPGKLMDARLKNPESLGDRLVAFKIYAPMGSELAPIKDCATRHGFITVCGDSEQELYQNFDLAYDQLELTYQ